MLGFVLGYGAMHPTTAVSTIMIAGGTSQCRHNKLSSPVIVDHVDISVAEAIVRDLHEASMHTDLTTIDAGRLKGANFPPM